MDKQDVAKILFVNANLSGKEIAEKFSVSENTISTWREKGEWDDAKKAKGNISKMRFDGLCNLYARFFRLSGMSDKDYDEDKISKVTASIKRLEDRIPAIAFEQVGQEFILFLYETQTNETAELIQNIYSDFIIYLTSERHERS
ncbi:hypothetical protein V9L05_19930 [Bernardetia sp. Wsw4-3y2]|uniref:hypothetical protein n=1 Tax=Bernardetia sp. Wsw4-3y2 TaxID=3127471 RepID=UPI0030CCFBC2